MANRQQVHNMATRETHIQRERQSYSRNVEKVLDLLEELKGKLDQAKDDLRSAVRLQNLIVQGPADAGLDDQDVLSSPRTFL